MSQNNHLAGPAIASPPSRINYTEFPSGRQTFTRGLFVGWYRGGEFGMIYAVVQRRKSVLYIPKQDVEPASRSELPDTWIK